MKSLNSYLDCENGIARMFRQKEINLPLSQADVDALVDKLSTQLSPENLTCDGELPASEVRARAKMLNGAYKDLTKYGEKNGLDVAELCY